MDHQAGLLDRFGYGVVVHLLAARDQVPVGETVVLVHGYGADPRENGPLVACLLDERYRVVVVELPGHGLSGGPRGDIDSFETYAWVLRRVVDGLAERGITRPHVVGHSTGASAIVEGLRTGYDPFTSIVFLSPLIQIRMLTAVRTVRRLLPSVVSAIPTGRTGSHAVPYTPLSWVDAYTHWEGAIRRTNPIRRPLLVLQGTRDRVLNWRSNLLFLKRTIPLARIQLIRGGKHAMIARNGYRGTIVINAIVRYLASTP